MSRLQEAEVWRQIDGHPDYDVSSLGRVVRARRDFTQGRITGKSIAPHLSRHGYYTVSLCHKGKKATTRLNRIVCGAFHGPSPSALHQAAHADGDRLNNRADNLRWATPSENAADKIGHGTAQRFKQHWSVTNPGKRPRGERNGWSKLTAEAVMKIREDDRFQRVIAAEYGVSQASIWRVKHGLAWGHI